MNCEQAKPLIDAYADGELDVATTLELEKHIRECRACASAWHNVQSLKKAVKQDAVYFSAPAGLRRSIITELHSQVGTKPERTFWNWNWLQVATSGFAIACLALLLTVTVTRPSAQQQFAQEVVSSHVRSLLAAHMLDVVSTDQHTVKPWFDGKLDFAPPVRDLAAQEFPLIGGRLDYLGGHPVAALVFQRRKHVINLFVWPGEEADSKPSAITPIRGYNLIHWSQTGMNFWAVSDLNGKELSDFADKYGN